MTQRPILYVLALVVIFGVAVSFAIAPATPAMWVAIVIVSAAAAATLASLWTERRRQARAFSSREELSDEDIYRAYYGTSGLAPDKLHEVWNEVATTLHLPAGKLRPSDRFGEELRGSWLVDNEMDALTIRAQSRARQQQRDFDASVIKTLDDYVRVFCSTK